MICVIVVIAQEKFKLSVQRKGYRSGFHTAVASTPQHFRPEKKHEEYNGGAGGPRCDVAHRQGR